MKVNILGAEYEIIPKSSNEDVRLHDADGFCGVYDRTIIIEKNIFIHCQQDNIDEVRNERVKFIKRHEIIHAFFYESGLDNYSNNEELVTWIARQFPKILEVYEVLECAK